MIMGDYSHYSYCRLLEHLEEKGKQYSDRRNYAEYLLSMNEADSIDSLIKIYNNVFKLLAILFYGTDKLPSNWYVVETWGYNRAYLLEELNDCYNQNLLVLYKRIEAPTLEQFYTFIANLKKSDNYSDIEEQIIKCSNLDINKESSKIASIRRSIQCLSKRTNSAFVCDDDLRKQSISAFTFLGSNQRIFDVREFYYAKRSNIDYISIIAKYKEEEEARIEQENLRKKNLKKERIISFVVLLCSILATAISIYFSIALLAVFASCVVLLSTVDLLMSYKDNTRSSKKRINDEQEYLDARENYAYNVMNEVGEIGLSFLISLPFAFFGGIFRSMGKRR